MDNPFYKLAVVVESWREVSCKSEALDRLISSLKAPLEGVEEDYRSQGIAPCAFTMDLEVNTPAALWHRLIQLLQGEYIIDWLRADLDSSKELFSAQAEHLQGVMPLRDYEEAISFLMRRVTEAKTNEAQEKYAAVAMKLIALDDDGGSLFFDKLVKPSDVYLSAALHRRSNMVLDLFNAVPRMPYSYDMLAGRIASVCWTLLRSMYQYEVSVAMFRAEQQGLCPSYAALQSSIFNERAEDLLRFLYDRFLFPIILEAEHKAKAKTVAKVDADGFPMF